MKYFLNSSIFFFSVFISLGSYCQPLTHSDDLLYYSTIALQLKDITPKVHSFWGEIKQSVITATENGNHKLDASTINSLSNGMRNNVNELDRKIRMIGSLDETDKELNLKQNVIDNLTEAKNLEEWSFSKVIQYLGKGIDKLSGQEKQLIKICMLKAEEVQKKSGSIPGLLIAYRTKHNITNTELEKYGL